MEPKKSWWRVGALCCLVFCFPIGISVGRAATDEGGETSDSVRFSATDHLIFSDSKDPSDPSSSPLNLFMHEDTARGEYRDYSLGIHFTNQFTTNGPATQNAPFTLEKAYGHSDWGNFSLTLGDSHQELGRGIALSLFEDPVFGLDTTVQGAALRFHPQGFDANLFGGRVNTITNPVAINPLPNPLLNSQAYVAAGQTAINLAQDTKVGAHYMFMYLIQQPGPNEADTDINTVGATFQQDGLLGNVDIYGETNLMMSQTPGPVTTTYNPNAYATYGSVTWSPVPWQAKFEMRDYRNYQFAFQRPPTLEEDIDAYINYSDITEAKVTGTYQTESNDTFYASAMSGQDRETGPFPIYQGVVGTKFYGPAKSEFELRTGYRWEPGAQNLTFAGVKSGIRTFKGQSIEFGVQHIYWNLLLNTGFPSQENRNIFNLTYIFSEHVNATLGYEYVPSNPANLGYNFFNVGGTYKVGSLVAKAFIGQTSGGPQCAGGVCRQVPPFSGAMAETTYVF